jgi:hypothetical protein
MASLRRTPVARPSGAELVRQIASETAELPPTRREPELSQPTASPPANTATEQINFRGSPELARILARLAAERGSIRLVVARCCAKLDTQCPKLTLRRRPDAADSELEGVTKGWAGESCRSLERLVNVPEFFPYSPAGATDTALTPCR